MVFHKVENTAGLSMLVRYADSQIHPKSMESKSKAGTEVCIIHKASHDH